MVIAADRPRIAIALANVLLVAFMGATLAQVSHEGTHALVALTVGSRLEQFHLFAEDNTWPGGPPADAAGGGRLIRRATTAFVALGLLLRFVRYLADFPLQGCLGERITTAKNDVDTLLIRCALKSIDDDFLSLQSILMRSLPI